MGGIEGILRMNNSTLTSLELNSIKFRIKLIKRLLDALSNNTVINSLSLRNNKIGLIDAEEGNELANFIRKNTVKERERSSHFSGTTKNKGPKKRKYAESSARQSAYAERRELPYSITRSEAYKSVDFSQVTADNPLNYRKSPNL
ncbi:12121_t:CDS:2 [Dentiscutata erythropus]|uniref:12121_t:CDS:1 n=1 Tax=Dentiscutata erythropus TaxID=1348616 RepID=A0A9N9BR68_9GLOM|nr:12121_t:CDS:2 [Dentiscutata erythropus]